MEPLTVSSLLHLPAGPEWSVLDVGRSFVQPRGSAGAPKASMLVRDKSARPPFMFVANYRLQIYVYTYVNACVSRLQK